MADLQQEIPRQAVAKKSQKLRPPTARSPATAIGAFPARPSPKFRHNRSGIPALSRQGKAPPAQDVVGKPFPSLELFNALENDRK